MDYFRGRMTEQDSTRGSRHRENEKQLKMMDREGDRERFRRTYTQKERENK